MRPIRKNPSLRVMSATETWLWALAEALGSGSTVADARVIALSAVHHWNKFLERRAALRAVLAKRGGRQA